MSRYRRKQLRLRSSPPIRWKITQRNSISIINFITLLLLLSIIVIPSVILPRIKHDLSINKTTNQQQHRTTTTTTTSPIVIAYAISLTSCSDRHFADGAAVLAHSIHRSHSPSHNNSRYSYKLYAFVHSNAKSCSPVLQTLGYDIRIVETPIKVSEIRGEFLRETVVKRGCCQEKEYIKLYSYTLLDHPVVVHLDMDTLVLQPMDELYDAIIYGLRAEPLDSRSRPIDRMTVMFPDLVANQDKVDAFFVRDYNMAPVGKKNVCIQGGFFVVRPDRTVFEEYLDIIREGDYRKGSGWGGLGWGGTYGAQQIQGIMAYYYDHLHPGTAVELNRCVYDTMADNPKNPQGVCRKPVNDHCEDCRQTKMSQIKLIHFTICQKPWICYGSKKVFDQCDRFVREWFQMRLLYDKSKSMISGGSNGVLSSPQGHNDDNDMQYSYRDNMDDKYFGYCKGGGYRKYTPMEFS